MFEYVPAEIHELADYVVWMIATMPEFKSSMTPDGTPDIAFSTLKQALTIVCPSIPESLCRESVELADLARKELDRGNEQESYEALNRIYISLSAIAPDGGEPIGLGQPKPQ